MMLDRDELLAAFQARELKYVRANKRAVDALTELLQDLGRQHGVRDEMTVIGEPKPFESFYRKAVDKYDCGSIDEAFDRVRDLARVRVITHTITDSYAIVDLLRKQTSIEVDETSIDDWIETPSPTGYRAIHLDLTVDTNYGGETKGVPVELQIRTTLQEAWGHYTHADFYRGQESPLTVKTLMRELSDLLFWADRHAAALVTESAASSQPLAHGSQASPVLSSGPPAPVDAPAAGEPPAG